MFSLMILKFARISGSESPGKITRADIKKALKTSARDLEISLPCDKINASFLILGEEQKMANKEQGKNKDKDKKKKKKDKEKVK
jgi:hypothetical protein